MSAAPATKTHDEYRLPLDVKPTHYDLTIRTDLEKLTFDGFVKIQLEVRKETSTIVLNTAELQLGDASLYSGADETAQIEASRTFDSAMERVTFVFAKAIPAGSTAQLQVGFRGELTSSMQGYYKSQWEQDGKKEHYALTQFESTAARKSFPCFDEPALKATFAVTLISRADTVNLSNMNVISEEDYVSETRKASEGTVSSVTKWFTSLTTQDKPSAEKWKITRFDTTPPMSTYLVAFANGDFKYLESSYTSPLSGKTRPLRIYTTADGIHQAQFALDVKAKVLPIYEKIFDIEYPLPKLDTLVAHDFDAGAMENWGLITGRTSAFLLDPKRADIVSKKRVVAFQSHEVAHMWFGDITTMAWWDTLFLNEGFATLMGEVIIVDKIYPEWKVDASFITEHLQAALRLDAKLSSHPIEVPVPSASEIDQIFDSLSYSKAGSALRMLADYVGEERFLKGVSIYLKKHLYGNTVTKDLWEGIGEATGIDIAAIMENWITKIGFPILTVTEGKNSISVRQDRFLESGPAPDKENETIWTTPLSLVSVDADGKVVIDKSVVLDTREKALPGIDPSRPFKLNAGTSGVYRVLYTPERLASIAAEAAKGDDVFTLKDRIGLVHDAFALARAGFSDVSSALTLVEILKNEKEFLVWDSMSENVSTLASAWWESDVLQSLNTFRRALYNPIIHRLGYEYSDSDSADVTELRTRAISQAAEAGDPEVLKELKSRFDHYMQTGDDSKIPADLMKITFTSATQHGGREEYNFAKKICQNPPNPSAKSAAIYAMGSTEDLELINETLDYVMATARDQDVIYFFAAISANHKTRRLLAEFFMKNYDAIYKRFEGNTMLRSLIPRGFNGLSTEADYQKISEFFKDKDISKYNLSLAQTKEAIRSKISWLKRSTDDIRAWLTNWEKSI